MAEATRQLTARVREAQSPFIVSMRFPFAVSIALSTRTVYAERSAMAQHACTVIWERDGSAFVDNRYSRAHRWHFDGGVSVPASASPHVVPAPMSVAAAVDPEEAYVASLASCHMLWFLALAARDGFVVDDYRDDAFGELGKDASGRLAMTRVTLRPHVIFGTSDTAMPTNVPTNDMIVALHHEAHDSCFIANSVRTELRCEPVLP